MTHIKKLVMQGFKSFPKKTEIPFTPGINVVLGPNGSGKSNISDAICFVLGRLSIKSMRAAKAGNLIFLGTKAASPSKEAVVEIVFDNSNSVFSLEGKEVSLKRIVRRNGQSIYKINNETKTRHEVLNLLAQGGIDPQGFNIVLQGGIQNFVRMQPEERRKVIEEVSGISIYESRKEKSLRELEKTEEKLKSINSVLRERTAYLSNLEKEREQALKYKKLELEVKKLKASLISYDLNKKKKEADIINSQIKDKNIRLEKSKKDLVTLQSEIKTLEQNVEKINTQIQTSTGIEQEKLNQEIANLRADLSGIRVKLENYESKGSNLAKQKKEFYDSIKNIELEIKELQKETPTSVRKAKEIEEKKKELERVEEKRKKFYMAKSDLSSLKDRIEDKQSLLQNYNNESEFLIKHIETLSLEIFDLRSDKQKLEKLKIFLSEKKDALSGLLKRELELEKKTSANESEIENQKKVLEKISKLDVCPVCKNKITPQHMEEIMKEISPKIKELEKEITDSDKELRNIYQKKEIFTNDTEQLTDQISKIESDINRLMTINEKKSQIKILQEKIEIIKKELSELIVKRKKLEGILEENSNLEEKYETLKIEIQDISLRTRETLSSEVDFKQRGLERTKISLKQVIREEIEVNEEIKSLKEIVSKKEKLLSEKRVQEEELNFKFKKLISERDSTHSFIRKKESETLEKQNGIRLIEGEINDLKIDRARIDAEIENLEIELSEFGNVEIFRPKSGKEVLTIRLVKTQEILLKIGNVNLRSLEVYDSIKKEYDSIKEKAEIISQEKEGIFKVIQEIDTKKKKTFLKTLKILNELFTRNFSQLTSKGQVSLDIENSQDPFEPGSGVEIIVKTGHGKYFDVKSLSGGEQTLVALSLIFAIQEYSPYYFYLLDEIDAALDKKNSERLAGLLNKYMLKGQYIIITHNDEIISRATNLYGVSMHEGVSKVLSLKV
ncbi:chromosome segregation protein SMC [Patescibacteria group bacterium]|nr:chromosome segregation protein SMC [Patescibacteria group bacterium]